MTTASPDLKSDRYESEERSNLRPVPAETTPREPNPRPFDPTQGRQIGSHPYDDPTQGRKVGADLYDDPTQGRKVGADPYDDLTQGRKIASNPYVAQTRRLLLSSRPGRGVAQGSGAP
jgi:hypothetical protein